MNTDMQIPEQDEKQILDHAVAATTICQIEDIFIHTVPANMGDAREIVESVLVIVQNNFYLIPKVMVEDDKPVERPAPKEAITEPLYELWNSVSN
jgi:hypothetical protein